MGGPHNKDYSILGSILGPLILGNYHLENTGVQSLYNPSIMQSCIPYGEPASRALPNMSLPNMMVPF